MPDAANDCKQPIAINAASAMNVGSPERTKNFPQLLRSCAGFLAADDQVLLTAPETRRFGYVSVAADHRLLNILDDRFTE